MRKVFTFLMLSCIMALFAPPEVRAQSAQTVNETGGSGLNDGLKFVVNPTGALAVYRDGHAQYYPGSAWPNGATGGVPLTFRFSQGTNYNQTTRSMNVCSTTPVQKTGNTYKTSISGYVTSTISSENFFVTLDVTYVYPNNYFMVDYFVRSPRTLTGTGQTVHMYLDHDAMILGCDASFGYISTNGTGQFIGDYRPTSCGACPGPGNLTGLGKYKNPSAHGFKTAGTFRSYYTGPFSPRGNTDATIKLANTYNTSQCDDGIAVEFTAGPFTTANQTLVRSVAHCYGNNQTEFDNLAINVPTAPAASSPVTINFAGSEFVETEGDHTVQNVKIIVSGGTLSSGQVCSFTVSGGTAAQNTDYTYVKGFTIPAGNYSTPTTITLNNITIKDNAVCNENKWMNISIDQPSMCNDMLILGATHSAKITINDDEPRPVITTTLVDTVYNTGEVVPSLSLSSTFPGATITWTNSNTAIGLGASGTGNIPSFTASNTSAAPITATISVVAAGAGNCTGAAATFTITVNSKFNITYNYNGGVAPATANPTDFLVANLPVSINNEPTRTGYTFAGWTCAALGVTTPEKPFVIPTGTTQNVALTADWGTANSYTIAYSVASGITNPNTLNSYTYEDNVTISNPTIPGYAFKGWTIVNDEASSPAINPTKNVSWNQHTVYGNLQFSATKPSASDTTNWSPVNYSITYNYNSGNAPATANPTTYNALSPAINLNAPTRSGYSFQGWTITSSDSAVTFLPLTSIIPTGSYGNLTCVANWGENGYTIGYELNGATHPQTPISYQFTNTVSVANPTLAGYTFNGWTITNTESTSPAITPTTNVTFGPSTVFGDLTFKVQAPPTTGGGNGNWGQITYNINYVLNGGTHGASHPNTYTVTDNVSISIPSKTGYTFGGWTITNDSVYSPLPTSGNPNTTFGPSSGIYGNLKFTANWSTDAYTITYDAGAVDASFTNNTNLTTYNIEDTPISLTNAGAKRNGYTFNGWTIVSDAAGVTIPDGMSIPASTHGNLTCTAKWTMNTYNITFTPSAGVSLNNTNRTYSYEDNVSIANPSAPGYTFLGWTIVNDSLSSPSVPIVNSNWAQHTVFGNLTFSVGDPTTDTTNWGTVSYTITYNLNGGTPPATANPTQYNTLTPAITLNDPARTGYSFAGWTIVSDSAPVVSFPANTRLIPTGSYGNLTCTANWTINAYTIGYVLGTGVNHPHTPSTYKFTDTVTIADPTANGWTFNGWTIANDSTSSPAVTPTIGVNWTPGTIFGNLTLTANTPSDSDSTNWTKTKYPMTYNLNGGSGSVPATVNYVWGTTVTVVAKPSGMTRTDAMFIGWNETQASLVTTQAAEDAITPTMKQAGDTVIMPIGGKTLYAIWAEDANGPDGVPDSIPDYKQTKIIYNASSSVSATGTYPYAPNGAMYNQNTTVTVAGNIGNLTATKKILMGWNTSNLPSITKDGSVPVNTTYRFNSTISVGTTTINLYALWADDENGNGIPDYLEEETTTTTPPDPIIQPSTNTPVRGGRSGGRSAVMRSSELGDLSTRSDEENDIWSDWEIDDEAALKPITDKAFAEDCYYVYILNLPDFGSLRRDYQDWGGTLAPYEGWVPEGSVLKFYYNGIADSCFVMNADSINYGIGTAFPGTGVLIDSIVFDDEFAEKTGAWPSPSGSVPGYVYNTTMVEDPATRCVLGYSPYCSGSVRKPYNQWTPDDIRRFKENDPAGDAYPWYLYNFGIKGWVDPVIKFNKDLVTKINNGDPLTFWYELIDRNGVMWLGIPGQIISDEVQPTVFKHIYRNIELEDSVHTDISQYIKPSGRLDLSNILYGSPDLMRSINGLTWQKAYSPLSTMERIAVNDDVDIRLRDPGDVCSGTVLHFNSSVDPIVQRSVTIHSSDNIVKSDPTVGLTHYVEGHQDFMFTITFADKPMKVVAQGYYSGNRNEIIGDSIAGNSYQYILPQVTEPIDIYVLSEPASTVFNEMVGEQRVWTYGNTLYIRSEGATKANIYNVSGSLVKQLTLNEIMTAEKMESGVYVVELDGEHFKVIIR